MESPPASRGKAGADGHFGCEEWGWRGLSCYAPASLPSLSPSGRRVAGTARSEYDSSLPVWGPLRKGEPGTVVLVRFPFGPASGQTVPIVATAALRGGGQASRGIGAAPW